MAAHQAPPSLGFPRQEHWSGLPFPSPVHESEKEKWSRSVVSDSSRPHGLQPTGVGCHCLLRIRTWAFSETWIFQLQELWENKFLLFKAFQSMVFCYGYPIRLRQCPNIIWWLFHVLLPTEDGIREREKVSLKTKSLSLLFTYKWWGSWISCPLL